MRILRHDLVPQSIRVLILSSFCCAIPIGVGEELNKGSIAQGVPNEPGSALQQKIAAMHSINMKRQEIEESCSGYAVLGLNGELLLTPRREYWHFGSPNAWVMLADNSISIIGLDRETVVPYLTTNMKLWMHATEHCPRDFASRFTPSLWPQKDKEGKAMAPQRVHIILPKTISKREIANWRRRKPAGAIGQFFLDVNYRLRGLCKNEPFPNVLWAVRRDDGGLELVHSGPQKSGTYLEISPSLTVTFIDPEAQSWTGSKNGLMWNVVDSETGQPSLYACSWTAPPGGSTIMYVESDGIPHTYSFDE